MPGDAGAAAGATDLADLLARTARERPAALAVVEADGGCLTWAALDEEASRVAAGLGRLGVVAGRRVLLACTNRVELVAGYLGVLRAQAVAVPVNPGSTPGELARVLLDCGARLVVADPVALPAVRAAVEQLGHEHDADPARPAPPAVVAVGEEPGPGELAWAELRAAEPVPVPPLRDPEKLACLLYTSGTSGRPRAAMLTHRAMIANLRQLADVERPVLHGDDVVLAVLPLFHVYGLNVVLGGALWHGAKLVLAPRFDPQGTLDLVDDEAVSVLPVAPPVFAHWRDVDLDGRLGPVRLVLCGSAPLEPGVAAAFTERTGVAVHQGYGLTEAAPVVTSTLHSEDADPGSVGRVLDGIDIRLLDEGGGRVEGDDPGEISIRGANLFSGYWPDGAEGPDDEGWWSTGDVGFLDRDGDVFLVDRVRELVIVSGFNVYPVEVEDVVREVDGVTDAAVIGVPDDVTGEAVVAYVVAERPGDDVADAVRAHCEQRLARFKVPTRIEVVEALPHGVTGKVQKGRLRTQERRRVLGLLE